MQNHFSSLCSVGKWHQDQVRIREKIFQRLIRELPASGMYREIKFSWKRETDENKIFDFR